MDASLYLRAVVALIVVVGLIGLAAYIARRLGIINGTKSWNDEKRLKITESLMIDPKRRLVLIKCDDREHLVLLGQQNEIVLEGSAPAGDVLVSRTGDALPASMHGGKSRKEFSLDTNYDQFQPRIEPGDRPVSALASALRASQVKERKEPPTVKPPPPKVAARSKRSNPGGRDGDIRL